jgi:hypothetical protein
MEGTLRRRAETAGPQVAASSDSDREREDWFVLAMTMSERIEAREGAKNGELGEERRGGWESSTKFRLLSIADWRRK